MGRTAPTATIRTAGPNGIESLPTSLLLAHCSIDERRTVLEILSADVERPLSELAERVAAEREDLDPAAVPDGASGNAVVSLYHNHLQKLEAPGIIELDESDHDVTVKLGRAVDPDHVSELIAVGDGHWETLGVILSDPRRERVVSLLVSADGQSLPIEDLARAIAALERAEGGSPPEAAVESTRVSLHHVHLPKLKDAGLVAYDTADGRVTIERLPEAYELVLAHANDAIQS